MDTIEPDSSSKDDAARSHSHIVGWGADLDPADRPAVPMERTPPRLPGILPGKPEQQHSDVTVFHSSERPGMTPIFGTVQPPSGVSGVMRGWAFKHSENDLRHWLILLAADRVNVVEGVVHDLLQGRVPNLFEEMGTKASWKYDRASLVRKALITTAVVGFFLLRARRRRRIR